MIKYMLAIFPTDRLLREVAYWLARATSPTIGQAAHNWKEAMNEFAILLTTTASTRPAEPWERRYVTEKIMRSGRMPEGFRRAQQRPARGSPSREGLARFNHRSQSNALMRRRGEADRSAGTTPSPPDRGPGGVRRPVRSLARKPARQRHGGRTSGIIDLDLELSSLAGQRPLRISPRPNGAPRHPAAGCAPRTKPGQIMGPRHVWMAPRTQGFFPRSALSDQLRSCVRPFVAARDRWP